MPNGNGGPDDHDSHEQKDYLGNDIHTAPDGSRLTEKTDFFGNTVYEKEDGSNFIETQDPFGNTVYSDGGEVKVSERDDAFGNNTLTDSEGHVVTEHDGIGDTVSYRGDDLDSFGHDNDDVIEEADASPDTPVDDQTDPVEAEEGENPDQPPAPTRQPARGQRRLERAEVRRRPLDAGGIVMKAVNFVKWGFIIGFVLYHMIMSVLFIYWVLFVPK